MAEKVFQEEGVDGIGLREGGCPPAKFLPLRSSRSDPEHEGYYREAARRFKEEIDLPLILGGGIRSSKIANQLINGGITDYISLCCPLIREPDLINRRRFGDARSTACISCNLCFQRLRERKEFRCWATES